MTLETAQQSEYQGDDRWRWAVWIEGTDDELDRVAAVTYKLHRTFPKPIRQRTDRASKFRLDASGWGTFDIFVTVETKDGRELELVHALELSYPDDPVAPPRKALSSPPKTRRVFLSYSAEDAVQAAKIREALEPHDIVVVDAESLDTSLPEDLATEVALENADAYVVYLPTSEGRPSRFVSKEASAAHRAQVPMVVVGDEQGEDSFFSGAKRVSLKSARMKLPGVIASLTRRPTKRRP